MVKKKEDKKFHLKIFGFLEVKLENYSTKDTVIILCLLQIVIAILYQIFFR
jgi:hypothetical protein